MIETCSVCSINSAGQHEANCPCNPNRLRQVGGLDQATAWPATTPALGWQCPVCGQVYAPHIAACWQNHSKPATGGNADSGTEEP